MSESSKLTASVASNKTSPVLAPGQLVVFTPGKLFWELVIYKIKSLQHRLALVKHTCVFVVLSPDADDEWHHISCAGINGWIFIPTELAKTLGTSANNSVFRSVPSIRRFQDWKGNNHFFFEGRFIIGPDLSYFLLTNFFMVISFVVFIHIVTSYQITSAADSPISKHFLQFTNSIPFIVANCLAFLVVLTTLWLTAVVEPGIIPRRPGHLKGGQADHGPGSKFCLKCNQYGPPRTKHCNSCQNCIEGFDHHCPYTSTCIGRRNRKYFITFVFAATLELLVVFAACLIRLIDGTVLMYHALQMDDASADSRHPLSLLLRACLQSAAIQPLNSCCCLVLFVLLVKMLPFCQFHVYIVAVGQTTFEYIKKVYRSATGTSGPSTGPEGGSNPFDLGVCANYSALCCNPLPASRIGDLHQLVSREQYIREEVDPSQVGHLVYGSI